MSNQKTYTTAFPFDFSQFTRELFPPANEFSFGLIYREKSVSSRPLLRNLDTLSYVYLYAPMPLSIASADAGTVFEEAYHCFARAAFPSLTPFQGVKRDGRKMGLH
jgi:hypothetical protein